MAYKNGKKSELSLSLVAELTEDAIATIDIVTPAGKISVMSVPREEGRELVVEGVHISSEGIAANAVGIRNLRLIATFVMEELDYDVLRVEGEARSTGAFPSHTPRPIRFARGRRDPGRA